MLKGENMSEGGCNGFAATVDRGRMVPGCAGAAAWDADVTDWANAVAAFGAPEYTQLCQVWQYGETVAPVEATSVCKPSARDRPDAGTWEDLVRSPAEAECKAVYDSRPEDRRAREESRSPWPPYP